MKIIVTINMNQTYQSHIEVSIANIAFVFFVLFIFTSFVL